MKICIIGNDDCIIRETIEHIQSMSKSMGKNVIIVTDESEADKVLDLRGGQSVAPIIPMMRIENDLLPTYIEVKRKSKQGRGNPRYH